MLCACWAAHQNVIAEIQTDHGLSEPFSTAIFRQAVETAILLVRGERKRG